MAKIRFRAKVLSGGSAWLLVRSLTFAVLSFLHL